MMKFSQLTIFIITFDKIFALPNDIEKCRINDENCLVRSSNKVLRKYYGGITEIDLQSLDPFIIDKLKLKHDYGAIKADGLIYNVKGLGFSAATIEKISGFDKNLLEIHLKVPKLKFIGFYKARGELLGFPLGGVGSYTLNFYDFFIKLRIKLERYTRNGNEYFRTAGSDISSTVRTGDIEVPEIGQTLNWLANTSYDIILKSSLKSYVGEVWGSFYEKKVNNVLNKVPIRDLFLI